MTKVNYQNIETTTVSIIVPVFNVEKYLPKCLDSILAQTHHQLEVILIDDGSTDGSSHLADEYSLKDKRIRVIHQDNGGVSVARNVGLDMATGDFVAFMDGDDWVDVNWIESQLETLKKWDADIAVCGCELVYKNARQREDFTLIQNYIENYEDKKNLTLMQGEWYGSAYAQGHTPKKLMHKECLVDKETHKQIRFITDKSFCEDEAFTLHIYKNANRIAFNNKSVFYYRMRASSAVSDAKFIFKLLKTRTALREKNLINTDDFLLTNVNYLWSIKFINPSDLDSETATLFYRNIEWCRTHISDFNNVNCSLLKKIFIHLYLTRLIPFTIKHKIFTALRSLKKIVRRSECTWEKFE